MNEGLQVEPGSVSEQTPPYFSIVMPAHNEEGCLRDTCEAIVHRFAVEEIDDYEIVVVNDNSSDGTEEILSALAASHATIRFVNNEPPNGFGLAIRRGLKEYRGEVVCIVMADLSDSPEDILTYYRAAKNGAECVFGSRFIKGSQVIDYPRTKYALNRCANLLIRALFGFRYNDTTNAFKCYRRFVIDGVQPLLSHHFNITVELALKSIVRGYTYDVVPISWSNRKTGVSKLKIEEMGSRYLFITLYILLEKWLSKNDYRRNS